MWLLALGRSFGYAGRGVLRGLREERNLRIHLTAACYVTAAGFLAKLDGPHWGVVLLCIAAVFTAELINSALEHLCDAVSREQNSHIGAAKDAAAGAVLIFSLAAVGAAAAIFGPWILDGGLMEVLGGNEVLLPAFALSLPLAILWIRGKKTWKSKNRA